MLCACFLSASLTSSALAQPAPRPTGDLPPPGNRNQLQREQQLRDLADFNLDRRIRANTMVPAGQRALIDYGGFASFDYLSVRDRFNENHEDRIYEGVAYTRLNLDNAHEFFVRGRYTYNDWINEDDSFDGRGRTNDPEWLDRAYYRFDLSRALEAYNGETSDKEFSIQVGRDLVYWANGLVLGQRLDGIIIDMGVRELSVQLIAGITPHYTVDFDASRPDFDRDTRRAFYGAFASLDVDVHRPFAYVLVQNDLNDEGPYDLGGFDSEFDYNSYYVGVGSTGAITDRLSYAIEAAWEGGQALTTPVVVAGSSLLQVDQEYQPIRAGAVNARLEYLTTGPHKTRFTLEETLATGDRDRILSSSDTVFGNRRGSDNAFNAFGLINPGLAFFPNLSNLSITRLGVATFPIPEASLSRRLQIGADAFAYFRIAKEGVIDEATSDDGRFIGLEPDIYLNWQITSDVTLSLRYGIFFPANNLQADDDIRHFFFGGITYAF